MKIKIKITQKQISAIEEWKPLLEVAVKDYKMKIYPDNHDFSCSPPEIIEEQRFLKSRVKMMKQLISLSNEILEMVNNDDTWRNTT